MFVGEKMDPLLGGGIGLVKMVPDLLKERLVIVQAALIHGRVGVRYIMIDYNTQVFANFGQLELLRIPFSAAIQNRDISGRRSLERCDISARLLRTGRGGNVE